MASVLASVLLCVILGQARPSAPPPDQATLQRIRAGLDAPHLTIALIEPGSVRYRVVVEERWLRLGIPWDPSTDTAVAPYVHPRYNQTHYEYLRMVTPEEFRAGVLYPMGPNVLPAASSLIKALKRAARARESAAIREQIKEELRQIESRPPGTDRQRPRG